MAININRNVLDPFYRYKMPRLQAKVISSFKQDKGYYIYFAS